MHVFEIETDENRFRDLQEKKLTFCVAFERCLKNHFSIRFIKKYSESYNMSDL